MEWIVLTEQNDRTCRDGLGATLNGTSKYN